MIARCVFAGKRTAKIDKVCPFHPFFTYPLTAGVIGALQTTSQQVFSSFSFSFFFSRFLLPSGTWRTLGLSIHRCCLPTFFFFFFVFLVPPFTVPCKVFLPDMMNGKHDHTTAVRVFLLWSDLRVFRLPAQTSSFITLYLFELCQYYRTIGPISQTC